MQTAGSLLGLGGFLALLGMAGSCLGGNAPMFFVALGQGLAMFMGWRFCLEQSEHKSMEISEWTLGRVFAAGAMHILGAVGALVYSAIAFLIILGIVTSIAG